MKKNLFFLFALVAMMCVFTQSWAAQVTFRFVYDGTAITSWSSNPSVAIYKGGEQLTSGYVSYDGSGSAILTVDDSYVGQTAVYTSSLGHKGSFTVTESGTTVDLECKKLTVTTKDKDGNALTYQYIYIYDENGKSYSVNTDNQGNGSIYLTVGAYTYRWDNDSQTGRIDLTNDYELNLVKGESVSPEISTDYNVKVVCRYGDWPMSFNSNYSTYFYIYRYGDTNNSIASAYISSYGSSTNSFSVQLYAGSYWIRDPYGTFSQRIEVSDDMTAYLDYHKVKFVSKTGNTPNVGQVIQYRSNNNNGYYSTMSVTTDANGEASVYLLPGNYEYTVNGATYNFTVGNEDQTISIKTSKVVITLNCDDQSALDSQSFEWSTNTTGSTVPSGTSYAVKPENGKITIVAMPGNYTLTINGISTVGITVKEGENSANVQLYSVKFTTNQSTMSSLYLGKPGSYRKQIGFNTIYYLTPGEYNYGNSSYSSSTSDKTLTLDKNEEIALNYGIVTVTVNDTDGKAVSGVSVYASTLSNGVSTDANGKAILTVPYGTCVISLSGDQGYGESKTVNVSGDTSEEFTIPGIVTFNVLKDGQPYSSSYLYLYKNINDRYSTVRVSCSNGIAMARITPGDTWSIEGCRGTVEITEGCTVSVGTLSVSSEGMGVAFPMDEWYDVNTFNVIVGSTVRLTAIPVKDDGFQCWVVNGNEIASPVIDLEVVDVHTTATAVFEGAVPSARGIHCDVNRDGTVNGTDIKEVINTIVNAD